MANQYERQAQAAREYVGVLESLTELEKRRVKAEEELTSINDAIAAAHQQLPEVQARVANPGNVVETDERI